MKLGKADQNEIDTLMKWLQAKEGTNDPPPPFMRVVFGYETLVDHCCDPKADVLEWKPEVKHKDEALEDIARQKQTHEMDKELYESADFECGYDACIATARAVLSKYNAGDVARPGSNLKSKE